MQNVADYGNLFTAQHHGQSDVPKDWNVITMPVEKRNTLTDSVVTLHVAFPPHVDADHVKAAWETLDGSATFDQRINRVLALPKGCVMRREYSEAA